MPNNPGRPPSKKPKVIKLQTRVDEETFDALNYCSIKRKASHSEILREGIYLVKEKVDKEKE